MPWVLARWLGAAFLLASAGAKLAQPGQSRNALAAFAPGRPRLVAAGWAILVALELVMGAGVAAGIPAAAYAAGAAMGAFAAAMVWQISRGGAGAPCGCFGARGKVGWPAVARNAALAAFFVALPSLRAPSLSTSGWLAVGLAVSLAGVVALAVAMLALAREVGALRLAIAPQGALEIPEEGPELGSRVDLLDELETETRNRMVLAVFSSDGCPICQALEPAVEFVARDPLVALRVFDEYRDAEVWRALRVPGSPFAVALDREGTVLAKGTFNSLGQIESVMATAERRRRELVHA